MASSKAYLDFILDQLSELDDVSYTGRILLRVSIRNKRAIRSYQKAGFRYVETIKDEIAYSNNIEDFWIMELREMNDF